MNLINTPLHVRMLQCLLLLFVLMGLQPQKSTAQDAFSRVCYTGYLPGTDTADRSKRKGPEYDVTDQDYHVIPVVVHVIHDGGASNIGDDLIKSQIDVLNEDFGRYGNGYNEHPDGADTKIRFCLARRDPEGNPTNAINRVDSPEIAELEIANEMATKNASRWPTERYLNIWVVDTIKGDVNLDGTIQGYSRLPQNVAGNSRDGVVMNYRFFGRKPNGNPRYELGKTTSHEVGHYLNLYHTWGPNPQSDCHEDDEVDDTPLCRLPFEPASFFNPCQAQNGYECNVDRMTENYMDYSPDECLTIFTHGQKSRMRDAIADYRSGLVHYSNVHEAGCQDLYDSLNTQSANNELYPDVEVYPNPAGDFVWINTFSRSKRPVIIRMNDMSGRLVKWVEFGAVSTHKNRLPLRDVAPGLYVIEVDYAGETHRQKLMIR